MAAAASPSPSSSSTNDDLKFKVVLCGEKGVGKTALYHRLKDDIFNDEESQTVTSDQCLLTVNCGSNVEVKVNLWDTVGMETFESLTRSYFHNCFFVIIVYSLDIKSSLSVASDYALQAKENAPGAKVVLVENKIDLPESPHKCGGGIPKSSFKFEFRTSAKTGQGTKEMLKKLVAYYVKHNKHHKKCTKNIRVGGRGDHSRPHLSKCCFKK